MKLLHRFCNFFRILVAFSSFMFFMICQLSLPVLLTLNNYCFHNKGIPPPDRLGVIDQTFTKLDMVTSDLIWSQTNMVSTLILDSQKYGHNQIYLYPNDLKVGVHVPRRSYVLISRCPGICLSCCACVLVTGVWDISEMWQITV